MLILCGTTVNGPPIAWSIPFIWPPIPPRMAPRRLQADLLPFASRKRTKWSAILPARSEMCSFCEMHPCACACGVIAVQGPFANVQPSLCSTRICSVSHLLSYYAIKPGLPCNRSYSPCFCTPLPLLHINHDDSLVNSVDLCTFPIAMGASLHAV